MRETHLLVLQKKEKLFLALSLAAVVLCTVLAFGFAVPLQAAEPQVLPDTTGLEQYVLVNLNTADLSALCTLPGVGEKRAQTILDYRTQNGPFERVEGPDTDHCGFLGRNGNRELSRSRRPGAAKRGMIMSDDTIFINRELSWLDFNRRVLALGKDCLLYTSPSPRD